MYGPDITVGREYVHHHRSLSKLSYLFEASSFLGLSPHKHRPATL